MAQQNDTAAMIKMISTRPKAPKEALVPYMGCAFTPAELCEVKQYAGCVLPEIALLGAVPRDIPAGSPPYRSNVYIYDALPRRFVREHSLRPMRYSCHLGQTKLALTEVEAITRAMRRAPAIRWVVYAGAAPGEHLPFLAELFPELEFHCYDPQPFRVQQRAAAFPGTAARITTRQGLFTDEIARGWADRADRVFFISDIRSGSIAQEGFESEVWENMRQQRRWWELMSKEGSTGPAAALFKFRLPYTDGVTNLTCEYLDGDILLQAFAPNSSTEGRLLVWSGAGERQYDSAAYESFYFWLNSIVREWASFDCGFDLSRIEGLCRCFDCSRMVQILREYCRDRPQAADARSIDSRSIDEEVVRLFGRMAVATGQRIRRAPHGELVTGTMAEKRLALIGAYSDIYARRRQKKIQRDTTRKPIVATALE